MGKHDIDLTGWKRIKDELPSEKRYLFYYFEITGVGFGMYERVPYPKEFTKTEKTIYGNSFYGNDGWLIDDVTHWIYAEDMTKDMISKIWDKKRIDELREKFNLLF